MFDSIERGECPRWALYIQLTSDAQAKAFGFNPFDPTKVWLMGREAVVSHYPRMPHFTEDIIQVFFDEIKQKPETIFGNVKADVPADKSGHQPIALERLSLGIMRSPKEA
ncbi:catalase [Bradyrhizobium liaoningense]|nr:catalase [Bradyrhizobium liaoningense]MBR1069306.1 catalase [Bradyrhizobium liaoningense]